MAVTTRKRYKDGLEIHGKDSYTRFTNFGQGLHHMFRQHDWKQDSVQRDIYINGWTLYVASQLVGKVGVRVGNRVIWPSRSFAVFLPSFELAEWHILTGAITWEAYRFTHNDEWSRHPGFCFEWNQKGRLTSKEEVFEVLNQNIDRLPLVDSQKIDSVAGKTKFYLDRHYLKDLSIPKISKALNLSHSTMTHYFRRAFGISPMKYRKLLRLSYAAYLISAKYLSVTQACYDSGFNEYTTFKHGFQKSYGNAPSILSRK